MCLLFLLDKKSELSKLSFLEGVMKKHINEPIRYLYSLRKLQQL